jgi:raffinose/stachyose/melibiose transport system substrate-binding protein
MKIYLRVVFILLLFTLGVSSWAEGKQDKPIGPVTITIWDFKYGDVQGVQPAMKKIDDLIMSKNPGIKINHIAQANDNYYQLIRAAVQAGQGPDIVMFHGGVQAYEFDPYTIEMDSYIAPWRSEISEFSWAFCSEDGKAGNPVHMAPLTTQGFGIYYNKELFVKAGLDPNKAPSDYDSFMDACEKLKNAGIVPVTAGLQGAPFTVDFLFRALIANIYGKDTVDLVTGKQNFKGNAAFKSAALI